MIDFPILAEISFFWNLIAVLFVICCVALILIILVQKGKGGGLSSAFGGGASGGVLGTKTGDFLTWVTIVLVCIMLLFAVLLAKFYKPNPSGSQIQMNSNIPPASQGSTSGTGNIINTEDSDSALPLIDDSGTPGEEAAIPDGSTSDTDQTNN